MASFKALCLAAVASLAATAASAADLLPPPPPPVYAPPPPVAFGGGWYLRGDVGVGITNLQQRASSFNPRFPAIPGLRYDYANLDDQFFAGGGVGYQVNQYFRADITGEYRGAAHYRAVESYQCQGNPNCAFNPRGVDYYNGSVNSIVGLVNGYVDLGTWYGVTPYVGAGVGISRVGFLGVSDQGALAAAGGFGFAQSKYQNNFTYALMAGLGFNVTQNLKMEIGYRWLDQGSVQTGTIRCQTVGACSNEVQRFRLTSNDIRLGFRYAFVDYGPIAPAMPLIRKY